MTTNHIIKVIPADDMKSIIFQFQFSPALVDLVKEKFSPRAVYKELSLGLATAKKFSHWEIAADASGESALKLVIDDPRFDIAPGVWALFEVTREWANYNYHLSMALESDLEVKKLGGNLRSFQKAGVEYFARNSRGVLLADEMGLGKTVTALAAMEYMERLPLLIICPAVVKYNWFKECIKWLPDRAVKVIGAYKNESPEYAEIQIINYDLLEKHFEELESYEWRGLILDESHYLKNYKAKRTQLVTRLAKNIQSKLLLSGTPILNRPQELISQLTIMGRLDDLGGFWPFVNRYCGAYQKRAGRDLVWDMTGATNTDELNRRLRESCFIRHEKEEVLKELPAKTRVAQWVRISNGPVYEHAESDLIEYLKTNARVPDSVIFEAELAGLECYAESAHETKEEKVKEADAVKESVIQNYRDSKAYKAARAEALTKIGVLKQLAAAGKMDSARAWITNFLLNKKSLVVFAWHQFIIDGLLEEFKDIGVESIIGDTTPEERTQIVERFQNGATRLLVCNIQAGGVGITLTAADSALFLEMGWNPGTMDQAEDRIYRMGQECATFIYYMLGESTIDSAIWQMIQNKRESIDSAMDGFEFVREYMLRKGANV